MAVRGGGGRWRPGGGRTDRVASLPAGRGAPAGTTAGRGVTELRFRAMGSDAHVVVVGGPAGLAAEARRRIDDLERRWSRFLPDSEVSALTQHAGTPVAVSTETVE